MADELAYSRKWKEFGRWPQFEDTETKMVGSVAPDNTSDIFIRRDPNKLILTNVAPKSQHGICTDRIPTSNKGMRHKEGGWPAHIDPTEPNDIAKYDKQLYRQPEYYFSSATKEMVEDTKVCMRRNNEIDLFEEYFVGEEAESMSENVNMKTSMIFKDPNTIKRAATSIAWHPELAEMRVGITYSVLRFQQMPQDMPKESYIWNLNNPNFPEKTLSPPSPLCAMAFNHKNSDFVVGGSYNGSLSFFDTREGNSQGVIKPRRTTILEKSHHDPVYDVQWLTHGKSTNECFSCSTDGKVLWWDQRSETPIPVESMTCEETVPTNEGPKSQILGATSIEYNPEAGPLIYLIGTEQGQILKAMKRKSAEVTKRYGMETGKHHGPIYSIWRNPSHQKFFMSVGDWSAKIWSEDQDTPIMQTRYHSAYLTAGCWSPTRCGLFYLTRIDGFLDVWDYFYKQNEVAYSLKISDSPLSSISLNQNLAAIGDAEGTVSVLTLSKGLHETTPKEKETMIGIFTREFNREKQLEIDKKKANEPKKKNQAEGADPERAKKEAEQRMKDKIENVEETFFKQVAGGDEQELEAIRARGDAFNAQDDPAGQTQEMAGADGQQ